MNTENFAKLIEKIQNQTGFGSWGWSHCYTGMAWDIERKPTIFPSIFQLGPWLGIDRNAQAQLEYLYHLNPDGSNEQNIEYFLTLPLDQQKTILITGLTSLRDEGAIRWH
jgi:hypothetical protein